MTHSAPPRQVIEVGDGFWNIRGSFKLGGIINIGTQASLVRRESGGFVLLDACSLDEATRTWIGEVTGGAIEAIVNLHPFHTVFVPEVHELYPEAALYGTARHHDKLPDLPWKAPRAEDPELHELFAEDFDFTVPRGVDFISSDEKLHFSSVLAVHRASKTLHVDDTVNYIRLPGPLRIFGRDLTRFHFTLPKVLEPRAGAAAEFRQWARELIERTREVDNLCAAHTSTLLGRDNRGASISERIAAALEKAEGKLAAHEQKHG